MFYHQCNATDIYVSAILFYLTTQSTSFHSTNGGHKTNIKKHSEEEKQEFCISLKKFHKIKPFQVKCPNRPDNSLVLPRDETRPKKMCNNKSVDRHHHLMLGRLSPMWVPDNDTQTCMMCRVKFRFYRRRHHCRAVSLIFLSLKTHHT